MGLQTVRRLLALATLLLFVGLLCLSQQPSPRAFYQSRDSNYNNAAGVPFGIAYISNNSTVLTCIAGCTFAAQNIGTADATRLVVVGIFLKNCTTNCNISGVTVNGVSAAAAAGAHQDAVESVTTDIYWVACGTSCGTTTNIVVTTTNVVARASIIIYSVTGTGATINPSSCCGGSNSASSLTASATLTPPSGGGTIGLGALSAGAGASFTNLTSDLSSGACCGANWVAAGHNTSASGSTTYTITFTSSASTIAGSFATFSP